MAFLGKQPDAIPILSGHTLCPFENLTLSRPTVATVDIDADKLILIAPDNHQKLYETINLTVDISTTGLNGRDSTENAGAEAASTWYHLWVIAKADGTVAGWATEDDYPGSGTDIYSDLPADYIYVGYVGAAYNDASSNLDDFDQAGTRVSATSFNLVTGGTATTATSLNSTVATVVPQTAKVLRGIGVAVSADSATSIKWVVISSTSGDLGEQHIGGTRDTQNNGTILARANYSVNLITSQTIYYYVDSSSTKTTIAATGFEY